MANIFQTIRKQLADNNAKGAKQVLRLLGDYGYPSKALYWCYKQKVFKINGQAVKKTKEIINGKEHTVYEIPYFDFDQSNHFCDIACDIAENEYIKRDKAGYNSTDPVTVKFGKINDKYRYELECPNSTEDYEYESGTVFYPEDNAFADWVVKDRGWKDMQEFIDTFGEKYKEELSKYLKEFYAEQIAPEYQYGEAEEDYEYEGV